MKGNLIRVAIPLVIAASIFTGCKKDNPTLSDGGYESQSADSNDEYGYQKTNTSPAAAAPDSVVIQNIAFNPTPLKVKAETTVTWSNKDGFAHTVTSGKRGAPTTLFDFQMGTTATFKFETPGTFDYFCKIHDTMSGTVEVT
ncbi:MAG TPA: plastocyanin/azurin family copper-binding protein [Actinomycetota bacterium]|nr:plastocyanin/azurin family copper-binding protein [Actinomycetota bacterium]